MERSGEHGSEPGTASHAQCIWDRNFALLGLAMWFGTAKKTAPLLTTAQNLQSATGLVAMFLISVLWPGLDWRSFARRRVLALTVLRIILFALPFNFSTRVFDAIAPAQGAGTFAWVSHISELYLGTRVALLLFCSLGWQLPLRVHMPLQALTITMLVCFGLHPYCHSKLLTSPDVESMVTGVHNALALLALPVVPVHPDVLIPKGVYSQTVALVLWSWVLVGWLLPTVLLLSKEMAARGREQAVSPPAHATRTNNRAAGTLGAATAHGRWLASRLADVVEAGLLQLLPERAHDRQLRAEAQTVAPLLLLFSWWVLLLVTWCACCTVAPLFVPRPYA